MLYDGHKAIGADGNVDLHLHRILGGFLEFLYLGVLLWSFEEQLHLPTVPVQVSYLQWTGLWCS